MKLLVFAHVPPPHHGQSYMVKLMLDGFGGDCRKRKKNGANIYDIECYHVNARFSRGLEDIGEFQSIKLARLLTHCLEAIWCRFRYGVNNFYYVPAPGKPVALYRDWLVMLVCRPFFKKIIFHWHAAGMAKWLETDVSIYTRSFTYHRMKNADLSIILSEFNRRDAEKLLPKKISVVPIGVPDPCPDFERAVLPRRKARVAGRKKKIVDGTNPAGESGNGPDIINVLYLAHCIREKGVFDAVEGIVWANRLVHERKLPLQFKLTLIGAFASDTERRELEKFILDLDTKHLVQVRGFVSTEEKNRALVDADIFCFPTFYLAENQPGNLIEAMAYGLPVLTTRWRSIPAMFPPGAAELVPPQSPHDIGEALLRLVGAETSLVLRHLFLQQHTIQRHLSGMAATVKQAVND